MKDNALYTVMENRPVPLNHSVLKNQIILLSGSGAWEQCPYPLRLVEVWDAKKEEVLVFLTNHYDFGATTISALYKDRWQIELFFSASPATSRQYLGGRLPQCGKIQVWTL